MTESLSGAMVFDATMVADAACRVRLSDALAVASLPETDTSDDDVLVRTPDPAARTVVSIWNPAVWPVDIVGVVEEKWMRTPRMSPASAAAGRLKVPGAVTGAEETQ